MKMDENDWDGWKLLIKLEIKQLVGDDLFVTNVELFVNLVSISPPDFSKSEPNWYIDRDYGCKYG
jgi:hypothetical protein